MSVDRVGKYRILAKLGEGGMARVLLTMAEGSHGFSKLLVLKQLRDELVHDPDFLAMFLDEARLAARLNHPNIVQTYEVGNDEDRYFIAMEYLEGQPLHAVYRRIGRPNIPMEVHLRILADVLTGLEHAHKLVDFDGTPLEVVHRDVSPQNVFVTYDGHVKLVDFGIAKAAGAASITRQGMMKGKISYIAPEQARCEGVDARADLFAVGVMLWEAIVGRRLIRNDDQASVLARRMAGRDPAVRDVFPDVSPTLAAICDRGMAGDPNARFQTARQFREAIEGELAKSALRVGTSDIARLVAEAFDDERVRIRAIIEDQVRNVDRIREVISIDLDPSRMRQTGDALPIFGAGPSAPSEAPAAANLTQLTQAVAPRPRGRSLWPALAGAGGAIAAATLGMVFLRGAGIRSDLNAAPLSSAAPATGGDAAPATLSLVVAYPDAARLKLDGGYVDGHPFRVQVPKDGSIHRLEVEQQGFVTEARTVTFDRDIDMNVTFAARADDSQATAPEPRPAPAGRGGWHPPPKANASATAAAADDAPKSRRPPPSVSIDEDNPYKNKK